MGASGRGDCVGISGRGHRARTGRGTVPVPCYVGVDCVGISGRGHRARTEGHGFRTLFPCPAMGIGAREPMGIRARGPIGIRARAPRPYGGARFPCPAIWGVDCVGISGHRGMGASGRGYRARTGRGTVPVPCFRALLCGRGLRWDFRAPGDGSIRARGPRRTGRGTVSVPCFRPCYGHRGAGDGSIRARAPRPYG